MGSRHPAGASCGCGKLSHAPAPCWAAGEVDISTFGGDEGSDAMPSSVNRARLGEASSGALASSWSGTIIGPHSARRFAACTRKLSGCPLAAPFLGSSHWIGRAFSCYGYCTEARERTRDGLRHTKRQSRGGTNCAVLSQSHVSR
jgi:hypothetical protein